jgi:Co/Zn/Cd efflux system component
VLADPICSIVISLFIMFSSVPLGAWVLGLLPLLRLTRFACSIAVKKCVALLLHRVPSSVDLSGIRGELLLVPGVREVHDFHGASV